MTVMPSIYQTVDERIDNLLCYVNPYGTARRKDVGKKEAKSWLEEHLTIACIDAYSLLKYGGDVVGFRRFLRAVKALSPIVYYRNAFKPKVLLKQLAIFIGLESQATPHWLAKKIKLFL